MTWVLFLLLIALPLVFGIHLIYKGRRRGPGHPACGRCGYDVTASVGAVDRCPECGVPFVEAGILPPTQRRPGLQIVGLVLVLIGMGCFSLTVVTSVGSMRAQQARAAAARARAQAAQSQVQTQTPPPPAAPE